MNRGLSHELKSSDAPSPKEFFSKHALDYEKSESHARGSDLALLIELLQPRTNEIALDVATGTGFTAMELAEFVERVVAIDITSEMLSVASRLARERGITNIVFEEGDASNLSFEDSSFDILTTRRAAHHFRNISKFLEEAKRVLKPQGQLGIVDMSPPAGTEAFVNRIEILRDFTHVRALSPSEWKSEMEKAGLAITNFRTLGEKVTFERWLYPVVMGGSQEDAIRKEWEETSEEIRKILALELGEDERPKSWIKNRIILTVRNSSSS